MIQATVLGGFTVSNATESNVVGLSDCTAVMFVTVAELVSDQDVDHRVQVVEKRQEVEGHLGPSFVHCKVE